MDYIFADSGCGLTSFSIDNSRFNVVVMAQFKDITYDPSGNDDFDLSIRNLDGVDAPYGYACCTQNRIEPVLNDSGKLKCKFAIIPPSDFEGKYRLQFGFDKDYNFPMIAVENSILRDPDILLVFWGRRGVRAVPVSSSEGTKTFELMKLKRKITDGERFTFHNFQELIEQMQLLRFE